LRYLIRNGDEITPVEVDDIVSIVGAKNDAEVTTLGGRHLVRLSFTGLEARLDPASFVRVRRSAIIDLRRLAKAEPAGAGRLLAHMITGELVPVSRSGAQSLEQPIV
jgi:DNA-binding LytR/AlgR family response regulator